MKDLIKVLTVVTVLMLALSRCDDSPPTITKAYLISGLDTIIPAINGKVLSGTVPMGFRKDVTNVVINDSNYGPFDCSDTLLLDGYTILLKSFTQLPIVYVNTVGNQQILSKDSYLRAKLSLDGNLQYRIFTDSVSIKGRGNSTWTQDKKPYKIKFDNKVPLAGMPADKEYALLASYFDKSLLRNDVAFELSERLAMPWTPKRRFVELVLNGQYTGNYLLTETVKVSADRVNITPMSAKKKDLTGGYLVECDIRYDGLQWFKTAQGRFFVLKDPDSLSQEQVAVIAGKIRSTEDKIANYIDIRKDVDLTSWVKWMLVNEIMRNSDAPLVSSCFWYQNPADNKLYMGPVWDFDASSGNYRGNEPEGWYVNQGHWFGGLFMYHPYYKAAIKDIWAQYRGTITTIPGYIDRQAAYLNNSQTENYTRWDNLNKPVRGDQIIPGTYNGEIVLLKDFLTRRIHWMDSTINTF